MVKVLICIPTYNERENIEPILRRTLKAREDILKTQSFIEDIHILVIDDASPDGTSTLVRSLALENVDILDRTEKLGLGPAYIAGFTRGIAQGFTHFVEMDADASHQPEELYRLTAELPGSELILGTRWMAGGKVVNWPIHRKLLSRMGTKYASVGLGLPFKDVTGGYRILSRDLLAKIDLSTVQTRGYGFQIEMVMRAWKLGSPITQVPITFIDRTLGKSKMNSKIALEAIWQITKWSLKRVFASS